MLREPNGIILKCLVYTRSLDDMQGKQKLHATKVVLELLINNLDQRYSVTHV